MDPDTAIGGGSACFPKTSHSLLISARQENGLERTRALEAIMDAYWKPVYKYIRLKWRANNEDAKDKTQGFFATCAEKDFFARYDPRRSSFRTYLRMFLDSYLSNEQKFATRGKRGGNVQWISIDFATADDELSLCQSSTDFDALFEREWVRHLFASSIAVLETRRPDLHRLFIRYDLADDDRPTYAALAVEFNLPITTVTNHLAAARREFRRIVLERLREITGSDQEFRAEAKALLGTDVA